MSKKLFNSLWEEPDLNVYRLAHKNISKELEMFSCYAINNAIWDIYIDQLTGERIAALSHLYIEQYRRYTFQVHLGKPYWWNDLSFRNGPRMAALRLFINNCKQEGKKYG